MSQKVRDDQRSLTSRRETLMSSCKLTHGHVLHIQYASDRAASPPFWSYTLGFTNMWNWNPLCCSMCVEWNTRVFCRTLLVSFFRKLSRWKKRDVERGWWEKRKKWEKSKEGWQKKREYSLKGEQEYKWEFCFEDERWSQHFFFFHTCTELMETVGGILRLCDQKHV